MIDMPDISSLESLKKTKEELEGKIKDLQEMGITNPAKMIVSKVESMLLTKRQIAKKFLLLSTQSCSIPMTEEDAQLFIYGKIYYKDGKLYDNDIKDPSCVAKPGDDEYQPPIDKNHPLWQKIEKMIKDFIDALNQLGVKLGEFIVAIPAIIITIATSLIALVSAAIILPFGAGLPTALTTVQTMMAAIKELQAKISQFLPCLDPIIEGIGAILGNIGQVIVSLINTIFGAINKIVGLITGVLGLLSPVTDLLSAKKKESEEQKPAVDVKADQTSIDSGESVKLNATASGGDWKFTYAWSDSNGSIVGNTADVTVTPKQTTTYNCKVTDGTGTVTESSVKIKVKQSLGDIVAGVVDKVQDAVSGV